MTKILPARDCDCTTCDGGTPAPEGNYGGSLCLCDCHRTKPRGKSPVADALDELKKVVNKAEKQRKLRSRTRKVRYI